ncbi:HalOD1 output domain-containing protein [Halobaculum litoreum]|uniref:HalOD1 output domain-containing protein n=1 Tax=Halobaculum litoreum TaxID=3031998 RepID=A0ABD5XLF4_9EURY|nr:HalOD1 output domain-containing protein [Halobaculum sp. DT92]
MVAAIVSAVADEKGIEPTALERPLYDVIDSEALDGLFGDTTGTVTFEYLDTVVTVDSDGDVSVRPVPAPAPKP